MDLETIRELQTLVVDCSRGKRSQYDIWTNDDSIQKVKAYLRSLKQIGQQGNGERVFGVYFGPANAAIWLQIAVRHIVSCHVLITIVVVQDVSWMTFRENESVL